MNLSILCVCVYLFLNLADLFVCFDINMCGVGGGGGEINNNDL